MKTVYIVRHAKSSWDYPVNDKDRPLKLRGVKDAHLVSKYISNKIEMPERVYSSVANRALHTCTIFCRNLQYPLDQITIKEGMYDFSGASLLETIKSCDDTINYLMIFGHNHAITAIVNTYGNQYYDNIPTSGFVMIQFDTTSWTKLEEGKTILKVFPKDLK